MSTQAVHDLLDALSVWPRRPQVHFTGGEPFLHFSLLLEAVRAATERGIVSYVETSASWCRSEGQTQERFQDLRRAGLQALLISCSPFHAERIPPARTTRAIRAALRVFEPDQVIVYLPQFLKLMRHLDPERTTPLDHYEERLGVEDAGRILWRGYGLISGGRAGYRLGHLIDRRPVSAFAGARCAAEILHAQHSHLDLYGNTIPAFCGGLSLGSWYQLPRLVQDVRAGRYPSLIETLVRRGPYGLFEWAHERFGYEPLSQGYCGKCHLCVDVRRWLVERGPFAALQPLTFYDHF